MDRRNRGDRKKEKKSRSKAAKYKVVSQKQININSTGVKRDETPPQVKHDETSIPKQKGQPAKKEKAPSKDTTIPETKHKEVSARKQDGAHAKDLTLPKTKCGEIDATFIAELTEDVTYISTKRDMEVKTKPQELEAIYSMPREIASDEATADSSSDRTEPVTSTDAQRRPTMSIKAKKNDSTKEIHNAVKGELLVEKTSDVVPLNVSLDSGIIDDTASSAVALASVPSSVELDTLELKLVEQDEGKGKISDQMDAEEIQKLQDELQQDETGNSATMRAHDKNVSNVGGESKLENEDAIQRVSLGCQDLEIDCIDDINTISDSTAILHSKETIENDDKHQETREHNDLRGVETTEHDDLHSEETIEHDDLYSKEQREHGDLHNKKTIEHGNIHQETTDHDDLHNKETAEDDDFHNKETIDRKKEKKSRSKAAKYKAVSQKQRNINSTGVKRDETPPQVKHDETSIPKQKGQPAKKEKAPSKDTTIPETKHKEVSARKQDGAHAKDLTLPKTKCGEIDATFIAELTEDVTYISTKRDMEVKTKPQELEANYSMPREIASDEATADSSSDRTEPVTSTDAQRRPTMSIKAKKNDSTKEIHNAVKGELLVEKTSDVVPLNVSLDRGIIDDTASSAVALASVPSSVELDTVELKLVEQDEGKGKISDQMDAEGIQKLQDELQQDETGNSATMRAHDKNVSNVGGESKLENEDAIQRVSLGCQDLEIDCIDDINTISDSTAILHSKETIENDDKHQETREHNDLRGVETTEHDDFHSEETIEHDDLYSKEQREHGDLHNKKAIEHGNIHEETTDHDDFHNKETIGHARDSFSLNGRYPGTIFNLYFFYIVICRINSFLLLLLLLHGDLHQETTEHDDLHSKETMEHDDLQNKETTEHDHLYSEETIEHDDFHRKDRREYGDLYIKETIEHDHLNQETTEHDGLYSKERREHSDLRNKQTIEYDDLHQDTTKHDLHSKEIIKHDYPHSEEATKHDDPHSKETTKHDDLHGKKPLKNDDLHQGTTEHDDLYSEETAEHGDLHNKETIEHDGLHQETTEHDDLHREETAEHDDLYSKEQREHGDLHNKETIYCGDLHQDTTEHDDPYREETAEHADLYSKEQIEHGDLHNKETIYCGDLHQDTAEHNDFHHEETTEHEDLHGEESAEENYNLHQETKEHDDLHIKETTEDDDLHSEETTENDNLHHETKEHDDLHSKETTEDDDLHSEKTTENDNLHQETKEHNDLHSKERTEHDDLHIEEAIEGDDFHGKETTDGNDNNKHMSKTECDEKDSMVIDSGSDDDNNDITNKSNYKKYVSLLHHADGMDVEQAMALINDLIKVINNDKTDQATKRDELHEIMKAISIKAKTNDSTEEIRDAVRAESLVEKTGDVVPLNASLDREGIGGAASSAVDLASVPSSVELDTAKLKMVEQDQGEGKLSDQINAEEIQKVQDEMQKEIATGNSALMHDHDKNDSNVGVESKLENKDAIQSVSLEKQNLDIDCIIDNIKISDSTVNLCSKETIENDDIHQETTGHDDLDGKETSEHDDLHSEETIGHDDIHRNEQREHGDLYNEETIEHYDLLQITAEHDDLPSKGTIQHDDLHNKETTEHDDLHCKETIEHDDLHGKDQREHDDLHNEETIEHDDLHQDTTEHDDLHSEKTAEHGDLYNKETIEHDYLHSKEQREHGDLHNKITKEHGNSHQGTTEHDDLHSEETAEHNDLHNKETIEHDDFHCEETAEHDNFYSKETIEHDDIHNKETTVHDNLHSEEIIDNDDLHSKEQREHDDLHNTETIEHDDLHQDTTEHDLHSKETLDHDDLHSEKTTGHDDLHNKEKIEHDDIHNKETTVHDNLHSEEIIDNDDLHSKEQREHDDLHNTETIEHDDLHQDITEYDLHSKETLDHDDLHSEKTTGHDDLHNKEKIEHDDLHQKTTQHVDLHSEETAEHGDLHNRETIEHGDLPNKETTKHDHLHSEETAEHSELHNKETTKHDDFHSKGTIEDDDLQCKETKLHDYLHGEETTDNYDLHSKEQREHEHNKETIEHGHLHQDTTEHDLHSKETIDHDDLHSEETIEHGDLYNKETTERDDLHSEETAQHGKLHNEETTEHGSLHSDGTIEHDDLHSEEKIEHDDLHQETTEHDDLHSEETAEHGDLHGIESTKDNDLHNNETKENDGLHIEETTEHDEIHIEEAIEGNDFYSEETIDGKDNEKHMSKSKCHENDGIVINSDSYDDNNETTNKVNSINYFSLLHHTDSIDVQLAIAVAEDLSQIINDDKTDQATKRDELHDIMTTWMPIKVKTNDSTEEIPDAVRAESPVEKTGDVVPLNASLDKGGIGDRPTTYSAVDLSSVPSFVKLDTVELKPVTQDQGKGKTVDQMNAEEIQKEVEAGNAALMHAQHSYDLYGRVTTEHDVLHREIAEHGDFNHEITENNDLLNNKTTEHDNLHSQKTPKDDDIRSHEATEHDNLRCPETTEHEEIQNQDKSKHDDLHNQQTTQDYDLHSQGTREHDELHCLGKTEHFENGKCYHQTYDEQHPIDESGESAQNEKSQSVWPEDDDDDDNVYRMCDMMQSDSYHHHYKADKDENQCQIEHQPPYTRKMERYVESSDIDEMWNTDSAIADVELSDKDKHSHSVVDEHSISIDRVAQIASATGNIEQLRNNIVASTTLSADKESSNINTEMTRDSKLESSSNHELPSINIVETNNMTVGNFKIRDENVDNNQQRLNEEDTIVIAGDNDDVSEINSKDKLIENDVIVIDDDSDTDVAVGDNEKRMIKSKDEENDVLVIDSERVDDGNMMTDKVDSKYDVSLLHLTDGMDVEQAKTIIKDLIQIIINDKTDQATKRDELCHIMTAMPCDIMSCIQAYNTMTTMSHDTLMPSFQSCILSSPMVTMPSDTASQGYHSYDADSGRDTSGIFQVEPPSLANSTCIETTTDVSKSQLSERSDHFAKDRKDEVVETFESQICYAAGHKDSQEKHNKQIISNVSYDSLAQSGDLSVGDGIHQSHEFKNTNTSSEKYSTHHNTSTEYIYSDKDEKEVIVLDRGIEYYSDIHAEKVSEDINSEDSLSLLLGHEEITTRESESGEINVLIQEKENYKQEIPDDRSYNHEGTIQDKTKFDTQMQHNDEEGIKQNDKFGQAKFECIEGGVAKAIGIILLDIISGITQESEQAELKTSSSKANSVEAGHKNEEPSKLEKGDDVRGGNCVETTSVMNEMKHIENTNSVQDEANSRYIIKDKIIILNNIDKEIQDISEPDNVETEVIEEQVKENMLSIASGAECERDSVDANIVTITNSVNNNSGVVGNQNKLIDVTKIPENKDESEFLTSVRGEKMPSANQVNLSTASTKHRSTDLIVFDKVENKVVLPEIKQSEPFSIISSKTEEQMKREFELFLEKWRPVIDVVLTNRSTEVHEKINTGLTLPSGYADKTLSPCTTIYADNKNENTRNTEVLEQLCSMTRESHKYNRHIQSNDALSISSASSSSSGESLTDFDKDNYSHAGTYYFIVCKP